MNEVTESIAVPAGIPDELETLKSRATLMGITFHPNIKVKSLKAKIDVKLNAEDKISNPIINSTAPTDVVVETTKKRKWLTHAEFIKQTTGKRRSIINRLVRVRVACMNPNKVEWEGEIISVGSAKMGTFKKFVPFNNEEGYHIPFIIYEAMLERQYTSFRTVKGPRGEKIRKGKLVPEFNIEVMEPLTAKQIHDLGQRQLASNAID